MNNRKVTATLALMLVAATLFTACAENADKRKKRRKDSDETDSEPQELIIDIDDDSVPSVPIISNETIMPAETTAPVIPVDYGYEKAYKEIIDNFEDYAEYPGDAMNRNYDLIYIDEDNIPELVVEDGVCMIYVFTYADGQVHTIMDGWAYGAMGNHGYSYAPYQNLIQNSNADYAGACMWLWFGWIDETHELAYDPATLHSQIFPEGVDDEWDAIDQWDGESMYYYIGDREVTEEEYVQASHPEIPEYRFISGIYDYNGIMYFLNSETVPSVTVSEYEIIVQDCTWSEAEALCEAKGGHLATAFNSDEWWEMQSVIREKDLDVIAYYVGGTYSDAEGKYVWSVDNSNFPVSAGFWRENEPSLTGQTEDGRTVDENRMCILMTKKNDYKTYEAIDVPDNILDAAPSYAGKVAFICEYENRS